METITAKISGFSPRLLNAELLKSIVLIGTAKAINKKIDEKRESNYLVIASNDRT